MKMTWIDKMLKIWNHLTFAKWNETKEMYNNISITMAVIGIEVPTNEASVFPKSPLKFPTIKTIIIKALVKI